MSIRSRMMMRMVIMLNYSMNNPTVLTSFWPLADSTACVDISEDQNECRKAQHSVVLMSSDDLERELESLGHLVAQAGKIIRLGKLVVARVHADGGIRLGVSGQAGLVEFGLREFPAGRIPLLVVVHAAPSRI